MAHLYCLGQSGSGKSTLLKHLALQNIKDGSAVVFLDPHGTDTDELMSLTPHSHLHRTVLFDPFLDISWNPLEESDDIPLIATTLSDSLRAIWRYDQISTPVLEMMVQSLITTALESNLTLLETFHLMDNLSLMTETTNPVLKAFWDKYDKKTLKDKELWNSSTYNKLYALLLDTRMQRLFSTRKGHFSIKDTIKDKVLFIRLSQGQLGIGKTRLIGSLLLAQIQIASLRRDPSVPLHIYIDECHTWASSTIAEMLSGLRKFNVHLTVAHQYVEQLDKMLFSSLMGNCEERMVFRISREDASLFEDRLGRYAPHFNLDELEPFRYRRYPHHPHDRDLEVPTLPLPTAPNMKERIERHTKRNYT